MILLNSTIAFVYGAVIGSFLNVVILRLHENKRVTGRSVCPHCKHQLATADLIPIFSFILLKGRCRYCHHKLSWQYPLVELVTAVSAVIIYLYSPFGSPSTYAELIGLFFTLFFVSILIVVSVYDLRWGEIPDKLVLPTSLLAFFYLLFKDILLNLDKMTAKDISILFLGDLFTALGIGAFFTALIVLTKGRGMGGGDLKLSFLIGLALGFPGAIIALLLAFLTGALASTILLLTGKKGLKSSVAFGPFLALGAFIALVFGNYIWTAYLKLLGFN